MKFFAAVLLLIAVSNARWIHVDDGMFDEMIKISLEKDPLNNNVGQQPRIKDASSTEDNVGQRPPVGGDAPNARDEHDVKDDSPLPAEYVQGFIGNQEKFTTDDDTHPPMGDSADINDDDTHPPMGDSADINDDDTLPPMGDSADINDDDTQPTRPPMGDSPDTDVKDPSALDDLLDLDFEEPSKGKEPSSFHLEKDEIKMDAVKKAPKPANDPYAKFLQDNKNVVVNFMATYSDHSKRMEPKFRAISNDFPAVKFLTVNVEKHPVEADSESVEYLPTFVLYKDASRVSAVTGADEAKLRRHIADAFGPMPGKIPIDEADVRVAATRKDSLKLIENNVIPTGYDNLLPTRRDELGGHRG